MSLVEVPMGSAEVSIGVEDFDGAAKKFEDTFDYFEMDTKIHRFPAGLRGINYPYIVPRVVAIGPYHHGREHLMMMEEVKQAAVSFFAKRTGRDVKGLRKAFHLSAVVQGARREYTEDTATRRGMTDENFADMMLRDACFLLLYMDAYCRSLGKEIDYLVNPSWGRFVFSKRDSIENDIMLLENQLPWSVIQALIDLVSPQKEPDPPVQNKQKQNTWLEVVSTYVIIVGDTFKVREVLYRKDDDLQIKTRPPPHLLALLRRYKVESSTIKKEEETESSGGAADDKAQPKNPLLSCFKTQPQKLFLSCIPERPKDTTISAITPMELEEIGVKLKPSRTDALSDMDFVKGHLFHLRELTLAPLSLSDTRASCLVNMAAFEVCTASRFMEDCNKTAVCSYLALLAMFTVREDDVHKLRSQGLLDGPQSNMEMLTFFKTVVMHLPDSGSRFAHIMLKIAEYKNNSYRAKVYKLVYNNLMSIIKVLSIIGTLFGVYEAILSLNKKT